MTITKAKLLDWLGWVGLGWGVSCSGDEYFTGERSEHSNDHH